MVVRRIQSLLRNSAWSCDGGRGAAKSSAAGTEQS